MDNTLFLLIGGNQGDRLALLRQATDLIRQRVGSVLAVSSVYETEPWGRFVSGEEPQPFLNQALLVDTALAPQEALRACLAIEAELGRRRKGSNSAYTSRPIDIDLIFFNSLILESPELTLPHPRMHLRRFVLQPLCDIDPQFIHPKFNKSLQQLLTECPDTSCCSCCS